MRPDGTAVESFDPKQGPHLVSQIQHPNICSPTHFFYFTKSKEFSQTPEKGSICVASIMPYVEGDTFDKRMPQLIVQPATVYRFGALLADALRTLSANGLTHSDLEGRNIMVNANLEPVIIDFDLCQKKRSMSDFQRFCFHLSYLIRYCRGISEEDRNTFNEQLNPPMWKYVLGSIADEFKRIGMLLQAHLMKMGSPPIHVPKRENECPKAIKLENTPLPESQPVQERTELAAPLMQPQFDHSSEIMPQSKVKTPSMSTQATIHIRSNPILAGMRR
jgi:serine/threonine protein kinase